MDFAPGLLAIQESPPARLPRTVMYTVLALFAILLAWAVFGKLDIITSAEGHLVPQSYVKIVQPAEAGIVQEILVQEGQHVHAGQVLIRMDGREARADESTLRHQLAVRALQLRRIDAELDNKPLLRQPADPEQLFREVEAQYRDHRAANQDAVGQAREALAKAEHEVEAGREVLAKLNEVTPILKQQSDAYTDMGKDGYVPQLVMRDKQREYLEKARDLRSQQAVVASLGAAVEAARRQVAESASKYRSDLQAERSEIEGQYRKLEQDWAKQQRRSDLLELTAPQDGVAKDLATHTAGTVVSPGTVLLSLVPDREALVAEVMVRNDDVGFIHPGQTVKLKLAAFPFQKYGMLDGQVRTLAADSGDGGETARAGRETPGAERAGTQVYRALIALDRQSLQADGARHTLVAGMQVVAEINQGRRSVMEYLLSPLQKTVQESGRER
jgi:HlyD family secretion protein